MEIIYLLIAFLAGIGLPLQVGCNTVLAKGAQGNALFSAVATFVVGFIGLLAYYILMRNPWPSLSTIQAPAWAWLGGLFGAFYVASTIILAPKIGGAALFGLILAGQMIAAVILDHFGMMGFPHIPFNVMRFLGLALLAAGAIILRKF